MSTWVHRLSQTQSLYREIPHTEDDRSGLLPLLCVCVCVCVCVCLSHTHLTASTVVMVTHVIGGAAQSV